MTTITDNLVKLQELTQTNLEILQALNDALYSKQNNISVNISNKKYNVPSYIALENKINNLQANFENLVNIPYTGEACFNFDGNSRAIEMRGFTHTPHSLKLSPINTFYTETNNIFKDFLTPNPFIRINLESLPNDIVTVNVKKIIPIHQDLVSLFMSKLNINGVHHSSVNYAYKDLYKILFGYKKDVDYIEYDTKMDLPIRENIGNGLYVIKSIESDYIDEHLDEYVVVRLRNDIEDSNYSNKLTYKLFNETIDKALKVGDCLVTFDDSTKLEITQINTVTNELTLRVMGGEYLSLFPSETNKPDQIQNLSKLKFYSPIDFDKDKYIDIPLEEDQYIYVAIAALNNRLNVQSSWGSGLVFNTFDLLLNDDRVTTFVNYYKDNVNNVGDVLFEISSMMTNTITKYTKHQFETFTALKPVINEKDILVTQINTHLSDSESIKNIKKLYSQKKTLETQLEELNNQINDMNVKLSEISINDVSLRAVYINQLNSYTQDKNKVNASISKISSEIAQAANNSEVPIENAKYRIRGFFNCEEFIKNSGCEDLIKGHIRGINVQYRYKNTNKEQGNAMSINGAFIFSDWINMNSIQLNRVAYYKDGFKYKLQEDNSNVNEPSYNQIDIPISQGESVDIRLQLVYDYGYPFIVTTSAWSDILNIGFPIEYSKSVQILDILKENNDDVEKDRFNSIIAEAGLYDHIKSSLIDRDVNYHHKPEDISSGFYTTDSRVISLKDKLQAMNSMLVEMYDDIHGTHNNNLKVMITNGENNNILMPYIVNNVAAAPYDSFNNINMGDIQNAVTGNYVYNNGLVSTIFNLQIINDSDHVTKLYSVFPGSRNVYISNLKNIKAGIQKDEFVSTSASKYLGIHGIFETTDSDGNVIQKAVPQYGNQFITFRIKDVNDGRSFYKKFSGFGDAKSNMLSLNGKYTSYITSTHEYDESTMQTSSIQNSSNIQTTTAQPLTSTRYITSTIPPTTSTSQSSTVQSKLRVTDFGESCAFMYPLLLNEKALCLESDTIGSYITIEPRGSINIPIVFEYKFNNDIQSLNKTMSFDIKTSLYNDPVTYTFNVNAKRNGTIQDKIISTNNSLSSQYKSKL